MGGDINEPWKKNEISLTIKMGDKNESLTFLNIKRLPFMNAKYNYSRIINSISRSFFIDFVKPLQKIIKIAYT